MKCCSEKDSEQLTQGPSGDLRCVLLSHELLRRYCVGRRGPGFKRISRKETREPKLMEMAVAAWNNIWGKSTIRPRNNHTHTSRNELEFLGSSGSSCDSPFQLSVRSSTTFSFIHHPSIYPLFFLPSVFLPPPLLPSFPPPTFHCLCFY